MSSCLRWPSCSWTKAMQEGVVIVINYLPVRFTRIPVPLLYVKHLLVFLLDSKSWPWSRMDLKERKWCQCLHQHVLEQKPFWLPWRRSWPFILFQWASPIASHHSLISIVQCVWWPSFRSRSCIGTLERCCFHWLCSQVRELKCTRNTIAAISSAYTTARTPQSSSAFRAVSFKTLPVSLLAARSDF